MPTRQRNASLADIHGADQVLRGTVRGQELQSCAAPGCPVGPYRAERRGQDHRFQSVTRLYPTLLRGDHVRRRPDRRPGAVRDHAAWASPGRSRTSACSPISRFWTTCVSRTTRTPDTGFPTVSCARRTSSPRKRAHRTGPGLPVDLQVGRHRRGNCKESPLRGTETRGDRPRTGMQAPAPLP